MSSATLSWRVCSSRFNSIPQRSRLPAPAASPVPSPESPGPQSPSPSQLPLDSIPLLFRVFLYCTAFSMYLWDYCTIFTFNHLINEKFSFINCYSYCTSIFSDLFIALTTNAEGSRELAQACLTDHLQQIRSFFDAQRQYYVSASAAIVPDFQYTSLEDTRQVQYSAVYSNEHSFVRFT